MRLAVLVVVFLAFTGWSMSVVIGSGPIGFISLAGREPWAAQMLVDLSIALFVAWSWLRHDAKAHGIAAWPYIVGTLAVGSIAVLAYLIHRELKPRLAPNAVSVA
ncbi:MAG: hypothetical protein JNM69_40200 [Archangium sp.]|nr:hypothetical protein [Archangium sp.]